MESNTVNIHIDLLNRCKKHDRIAQFKIYKLYSKAMYNTALRIIGDTNDAEDVLQESFLSAFKNLNSHREDAPFGAWIKRIVINKSLSHLKKNKNELMLTENITEGINLFEPEKTEANYTVSQVRSAMNELALGFRTVLSLYLFEGYDHKEISKILNITESTSKSQYKRAKDKLRLIVKQKECYG